MSSGWNFKWNERIIALTAIFGASSLLVVLFICCGNCCAKRKPERFEGRSRLPSPAPSPRDLEMGKGGISSKASLEKGVSPISRSKTVYAKDGFSRQQTLVGADVPCGESTPLGKASMSNNRTPLSGGPLSGGPLSKGSPSPGSRGRRISLDNVAELSEGDTMDRRGMGRRPMNGRPWDL